MNNILSRAREEEHENVYYCSVCGYGYAREALAKECETYCTTHNSCSLQITAKAIRKPD